MLPPVFIVGGRRRCGLGRQFLIRTAVTTPTGQNMRRSCWDSGDDQPSPALAEPASTSIPTARAGGSCIVSGGSFVSTNRVKEVEVRCFQRPRRLWPSSSSLIAAPEFAACPPRARLRKATWRVRAARPYSHFHGLFTLFAPLAWTGRDLPAERRGFGEQRTALPVVGWQIPPKIVGLPPGLPATVTSPVRSSETAMGAVLLFLFRMN